MKIKTHELRYKALDYAVAKALGGTNFSYDTVATYWITLEGKDRALSKGWAQSQSFTPSTDWSDAGPIIEAHWKDISAAALRMMLNHEVEPDKPSILVFWMRCFVASKLGDEVDVPEVLA